MLKLRSPRLVLNSYILWLTTYTGPDWEGLPFGVDEGKLGLQWKHDPKKDNPVLIGLAIRRGKD